MTLQLAPGVTVEHYLLESLEGEGGQAQVWRAKDTFRNKTVALKLLPPKARNHKEAKERLKREAECYKFLPSHDNLLSLLAFYETSPIGPFLVLSYLEGGTLLSDLFTEKFLSLELCREVSLQLCDIVSILHERDILHRDIKSENVCLLPRVADPVQVKLLDLGLAKHIGVSSSITETGQRLGTPRTRPPEQEDGKEANQTSDLYSLGVLLWELCTGKAFSNSLEVPFRDIFPELVAKKLRRVLKRALQENAAKRYQSANVLKKDLQRAFPPKSKPSKPRTRLLSIGVLLLISLSFGAGYFLRELANTAPTPPQSFTEITPSTKLEPIKNTLSPFPQTVATSLPVPETPKKKPGVRPAAKKFSTEAKKEEIEEAAKTPPTEKEETTKKEEPSETEEREPLYKMFMPKTSSSKTKQ